MLQRFKNKYIGNKAFYKMVLLLAIPMILQNAVTSFVNFLDNIMVGQIGTEPMSGVAIVNQLIFVFNVCIFGGVSGAGIFGTQYFGKKDYKGQRYAFRFKLYACLIITIIALFLFHLFDDQLISLYLSDQGHIGDISLALSYGKQYMQYIVIGLIPFAISQTYINTIRESGHTLVPMLASVVAVFTNLVLDVVLIFGYLGLPKLGVVGAAIATVIARIVECFIVVLWTHMHDQICPFVKGVYHSFKIPFNVFLKILKKGTPMMLNEILWSMGMTIIVQCYAIRGLEVVAANNIASTITSLFNMVYLQLGSCIAIVVGQLLGAGKIEEAIDADNKMIVFSIFCCMIMASLMMIFAPLFPRLYNTQMEIRQLATSFITTAAIVMPLCAFSHCAYFTLRSGGKTFITMLFDSVYTWIIVIPLAFLLSNYTILKIEQVFLMVQGLEIIKVCIGAVMLKSKVWAQNVVNI